MLDANIPRGTHTATGSRTFVGLHPMYLSITRSIPDSFASYSYIITSIFASKAMVINDITLERKKNIQILHSINSFGIRWRGNDDDYDDIIREVILRCRYWLLKKWQ
jgi:hypothetical protein